MSKSIKIEFDADAAKDLSEAASEIQYLTNSVGEVFRFFHGGLLMGHLSGRDAESSLIALSDLCARAMEHACQKEGQALAQFSSLLDDKLMEVRNVT